MLVFIVMKNTSEWKKEQLPILKVCLIGIGICAFMFLLTASMPYPTEVGEVVTVAADTTFGSQAVLEPKTSKLPKYPMWVQYGRKGDTKIPVWGFVKVRNMSEVKHLVSKGFRQVHLGNFADQRYAAGTLPICDTDGTFWDPTTRIASETAPKEFLAVFWLDREM
jgi:hypothetical protein